MSAVLLVGVGSPFLRILSTVLSRTWSVYAACDQASLQECLDTAHPAVVVFEHIHPLDLYELNPRRFGFEGPILLIADDPSTARSQLETEYLARRSIDLVALSRVLAELIDGGT
jgi:hypothetical protein